MNKERRFIYIWSLATALVLSACTAGQHAASGSITDIQSVSELQSRFEEDSGVPRLILLLSPT